MVYVVCIVVLDVLGFMYYYYGVFGYVDGVVGYGDD